MTRSELLIILLLRIASLVITLLIGLYITNYVSDYNSSTDGEVDSSVIWTRIKRSFWGALGGSILVAIAMILGLFLCIIPGLLVPVCFALFLPVYVENRKKDRNEHESVFSILRDSYDTIKYDFLKSLGFLLVTCFIFILVIVALAFSIGVLSQLLIVLFHSITGLELFIDIVTSILISAISLIFIYATYITLSVLYFDLTGKDEYAVLQDKIENIGQDNDSL